MKSKTLDIEKSYQKLTAGAIRVALISVVLFGYMPQIPRLITKQHVFSA